MTFWLGFIFGVLALWLLIGLALTAWLMWSLKGCSIAFVLLPLILAGCAGNWLVVTTASWHDNRQRGYNETNHGIGIERPFKDDARAMLGAYRNSFSRDTLYAGVQWTPLQVEGFRFGGAAIAATGYEDGGQPQLFAVPMVSYEHRSGWGVNLVPAAPNVIGLQLKLRFQ